MAAKKTDKPEGLTSPAAQEILDNPIEMLKVTGIPIKKASFHKTIASLVDGTPEYQYYHPDGTQKKTRKALMWYTPAGLLIEQLGRHKMIPLANVSDTELL